METSCTQEGLIYGFLAFNFQSISKINGKHDSSRFSIPELLTWDQALFSFRFENYILAVAIRENVWELLKLGLISGYEL